MCERRLFSNPVTNNDHSLNLPAFRLPKFHSIQYLYFLCLLRRYCSLTSSEWHGVTTALHGNRYKVNLDTKLATWACCACWLWPITEVPVTTPPSGVVKLRPYMVTDIKVNLIINYVATWVCCACWFWPIFGSPKVPPCPTDVV